MTGNNISRIRRAALTGAAVLGTAALFAASASVAATTTASMPVTATVQGACTVTASTFNMGNYTGSSVATSGSPISVTCTNGAAYNVGLDAGTGTGATTTTRKLTSGSNTLNYTIYSNSARTQVWGNTVGTDTVTGTGSGAAQALSAYFSMPSGQSLTAGTYNDTVTVTVTY